MSSLSAGDYIVKDSTGDLANGCFLFLTEELNAYDEFYLTDRDGDGQWGQTSFVVTKIIRYSRFTEIRTGQLTLHVVSYVAPAPTPTV